MIELKSRGDAGVQPAQHPAKTKGSTPGAEDSDSDHEAPVAQQMLSFVMDDPDFESEASDTPQIMKVSPTRVRGCVPIASIVCSLRVLKYANGER